MKILMIEDEYGVAEYVGMFLRDAGYSVEWVQTGRQGRLQVSQNKYDLILLDLVLPDISGAELLPDLKDAAGETPVMVVTGLANDDERLIYCLKNGAAGFVPKSARADDLLSAVRRVLRQY
jgi:DNA-binding response OmpR family regulator